MEASREEICLVWRVLARTVPGVGISWVGADLQIQYSAAGGAREIYRSFNIWVEREKCRVWRHRRSRPCEIEPPPAGGVLAWTLTSLWIWMSEEQRAVYELELLVGMPAGEVM